MAAVCVCCGTTVEWWVRLRSHPDLPICHNCLAGLESQRDGQLQLLSGVSLVTGFEPVFTVADLASAAEWYQRAGFDVSQHDETYAFAHRARDLTIHLAVATGGDGAAHGAGRRAGHGTLYLHCRNADRLAEELRQAGIEVDGPRDEDHGRREGSITDPDGNLIRFGSPLR